MTSIEAAAGRDDPYRLGHDRESPSYQHTLGHAELGPRCWSATRQGDQPAGSFST
jgi:hypothetical protein